MTTRSVLQDWVQNLTFMQQSVLIAAIRGPDGIFKDHQVKRLCRWLRRCVLLSAFDRRVIDNPWEDGGGSFTGPSMHPKGLISMCRHRVEEECTDNCPAQWWAAMDAELDEYLRHVDELPHHFQLHFMHAAEIIGYKHPSTKIRRWWNRTYCRLVNDAHLFPESEERMDSRLGDREDTWRAAEEVTALAPESKTQ